MIKSLKFILAIGIAGGLVTSSFGAEPSKVAPSGQPAPEKKDKTEQKPPAVDLLALFKMHYDMQVRSFKEQNQAYQNVVLVGDSITEGFEIPKYFPGRRMLNRGIGGDVIGNGLPADDLRGVLRRLDSSVFDCAATDVFLMIGINDLNSGHSVDAMETGYRDLLRKIKEHSPSIRVHVESLLPTRGDFAKQNASVRDFNRRLEKMAAQYGYHFLNLHPLFTDDKGELKAEYTPEGLHLNEAGYRVWRAEIEKTMGWTDK